MPESDGTGDVILNNPNNAIGTLAGAASGSFQFANTAGAGLTDRNCELFHFVRNGYAERRDGTWRGRGRGRRLPGAEIQVSTAGNLAV